MRFYKAVPMDGRDPRNPSLDYGTLLEEAKRSPWWRRRRPRLEVPVEAVQYPTEALAEGQWPSRLFEVEGEPADLVLGSQYALKVRAGKLVRELPAETVFGPQGEVVVEMYEQASALCGEQVVALASMERVEEHPVVFARAREAYRVPAFEAARDLIVEQCAERVDDLSDAQWGRMQKVVGDAVGAVVVADLLSATESEALMAPWESVVA